MIVNIALLTVTDTRTLDNDKSGTILVNKIKEANHKLVDRKICKDNKDEIIKILKNWIDKGIPEKALSYYMPIQKKEWELFGGEVHYMSYFINWSPNNNYYYAKEHCNFEQNPKGRSEGTYTRYSSLDDKLDGQHYFTMFTKFGQGRAMNDANREIRDGFITRDEGLELVKKYDGEFPNEHFAWALEYMDINEEQYWATIDKARSSHLWSKIGDDWIQKHPTE